MIADACGQEKSLQGTHLVRLPPILAGEPPAVKPKIEPPFRPEEGCAYGVVVHRRETSRSEVTYYTCDDCASGQYAADLNGNFLVTVKNVPINKLPYGTSINVCRVAGHKASR